MINRINDYISISQMLFLTHLNYLPIEITSLSTDLNMKCRIDRIHTQIIDDKTFDDQGAMNFTLKFTYVVKNRVVIARKKYFWRQQIHMVGMNSST